MVEKHIKFIHKSVYREKLLKLLKDLLEDTLDEYDIKSMHWFPNQKRIRIGNVRIVFERKDWKNKIVKIDNRGDIY